MWTFEICITTCCLSVITSAMHSCWSSKKKKEEHFWKMDRYWIFLIKNIFFRHFFLFKNLGILSAFRIVSFSYVIKSKYLISIYEGMISVLLIWYMSCMILTWKPSQIIKKSNSIFATFLWLIMYDTWKHFCAHINVKRVIHLWYFELSQQLNIWMTINILLLIAQFHTASIYCSILVRFLLF